MQASSGMHLGLESLAAGGLTGLVSPSPTPKSKRKGSSGTSSSGSKAGRRCSLADIITHSSSCLPSAVRPKPPKRNKKIIDVLTKEMVGRVRRKICTTCTSTDRLYLSHSFPALFFSCLWQHNLLKKWEERRPNVVFLFIPSSYHVLQLLSLVLHCSPGLPTRSNLIILLRDILSSHSSNTRITAMLQDNKQAQTAKPHVIMCSKTITTWNETRKWP